MIEEAKEQAKEKRKADMEAKKKQKEEAAARVSENKDAFEAWCKEKEKVVMEERRKQRDRLRKQQEEQENKDVSIVIALLICLTSLNVSFRKQELIDFREVEATKCGFCCNCAFVFLARCWSAILMLDCDFRFTTMLTELRFVFVWRI